MKKVKFLALGLAIICASCSNDNDEFTSDPQQIKEATKDLMSISEINKFIEESVSKTGDVDWTKAPTRVLWSAIVHSKDKVAVGFGNEGESFSEQRSPQLMNYRNNLLDIIKEKENYTEVSSRMNEDDVLNYFMIDINKFETVAALQKAEGVRYIQPTGYSFFLGDEDVKSSAGCGERNQTIKNADYRVVAPNSWVPWNYDIHNITDAWQYSTGSGITVGVIDTGLSGSQYLMNGGFNDGYSNGRTVQRFGTYNNDGVNDQCGHGTSMSSVIASPRNDDGMPVGVAYNSNLIVYRGTSDVVLNSSSEQRGVSNALRALGNNSNVKVISMSIGFVWSIGSIKDAVKYAHSRGKLIFAAGGTSTSFTSWAGVIFPASMSETVAVTGIRDNGKYDRCDVCHDGDKIDFTIVMQRSSDNDRTVPVLGFRTGTRAYVGGSSIATATTAGIAALVWSKNPTWTRTQVLNKLKQSAEFYPSRDGDFGYGNIDALKAVK